MVTITGKFRLLPEHRDDFIEATKKNRDASIQEPGNIRFDILQSEDDPNRFLFYEAYESWETAAAHRETDHFTLWREEVKEEWLEVPREVNKYTALFE